MKLTLNEISFIGEALQSVSIKVSDAPAVSTLVSKLDKEFTRLQKLEDQKAVEAK